MSVSRSSNETMQRISTLTRNVLLELNEIMVDEVVKCVGSKATSDRILYGKNMFSLTMNFCVNLMVLAIQMDTDLSNKESQKTEKL